MSGYFITGTDTGVGKTIVTLAVMELLKRRGFEVAGMKPVASGCDPSAAGLRNHDAIQIMQACSSILPYSQVNPYAFEPAIAPHIVAARSGETISVAKIVSVYRDLEEAADRVVVEGVGGWQVPLGDEAMLPDLANRLELPVILVVGLRLGCINHTLLTAAAINSSRLEFAGWVANQLQPGLEAMDDIIETLLGRIDAPLLGVLPWSEEVEPGEVADYLEKFPE
jgi:dethiobiotin synthetase